MKKIRRIGTLFIGIGVLWVNSSYAIDIYNKDNLNVSVYGRLQEMVMGEFVQDPYKDHLREYLYTKQARLGTSGNYDKYKFNVQMSISGDETLVTGANNSSNVTLLDYYVDLPIMESYAFRMGQFKVPYSRERLTDQGYLDNVSLSIQNIAFDIGREDGVALYGQTGKFASALGLFTGGGRDVPERFLPESLGYPLTVLRLGINDGLDEDVFSPKQAEFEPTKTGFAAYVDGLYTRDTAIGHSTALNTKSSEKSLLLDSNWNPFIANKPLNKGDFWQIGGDIAFREHVGDYIFASDTEGNYSAFSNIYGNLSVAGGETQVSLYKKPYQIGVRYAVILPDSNSAYTNAKGKIFSILSGLPIHEIAPSATYFFNSHFKIVADVPVLVNVPVASEPGVGSYVITEQVDQVSVLDGGMIERQTVVEGRLMLEFAF